MKRFALLFGALMLWIPATGCDSSVSSNPTGSADSKVTTPHPRAKGEVKAYEEKNAKRLAERAEKINKTSRPASR